MKKKCFIIVLLLLVPLIGFSQADEWKSKMDYIFQRMYLGTVPGGILREYAAEFAHLPTYNGTLNDSNYVDVQTWRKIYATLYTGRVPRIGGILTPMTDLETLNAQIEATPKNPINLLALFKYYGQFKPNAYSSRLVAVDEEMGQIYISTPGAEPFEQKSVFAVAPEIGYSQTGTVQFILRSSLFTNDNYEIPNPELWIDAGDGLGYRNFNFDTPVNINYATEGLKTLKVKISYPSLNLSYESQSYFTILQGTTPCTSCRFVVNDDLSNVRRVVIAPNATHSGGEMQILLSVNNTTGRIRKPLIVVEGFDIAQVPAMIRLSENTDIRNFVFGINRSNREGYNFNQSLDDLASYDLVYVDYGRGTDDIRRNAALFQEILTRVNQEKATNGSTEQNVVIGESMGGLVARYGLADLARQNIPTQTRLLITHDSPHQGANVPLGFQALFRESQRIRVAGVPIVALVSWFTGLHNYTMSLLLDSCSFTTTNMEQIPS